MEIDQESTAPKANGQNINSPATLNKMPLRRSDGAEAGTTGSSGSWGRGSGAVMGVLLPIRRMQRDQRSPISGWQSTTCRELVYRQGLAQFGARANAHSGRL